MAVPTKIMDKSVLTVEKMNGYLLNINPNAPAYADIYLAEGLKEGVRGDIAFCQSLLETGNFKFVGSMVSVKDNNFAGLGATTGAKKVASFPTPQIGIRAQIQHLKAYACTDKLNLPTVDTRFKYVTRGCAPYVEWLGQRENPRNLGWATGAQYGQKIMTIYKGITNFKISDTTMTSITQDDIQHRSTLIKQTQNWINFYLGMNILAVNGVAGPQTQTYLNMALKKYINEKFRVKLLTTSSTITPTVKQYFKKMIVKTGVVDPFVMIFKMYLLIDGYSMSDLSAECTKEFSSIIAAFQKSNNLIVDKIAGYNTWCAVVGK